MDGAVRSREIVRTPADRTGSRGYTMTKRSPHSPIGRGSRLKIGAVSVRVRLGAQDCGEALDGRETTSETASELKAGERETGRSAGFSPCGPTRGPCKPLRVSGLSERSKIRHGARRCGLQVLYASDLSFFTRPTFCI